MGSLIDKCPVSYGNHFTTYGFITLFTFNTYNTHTCIAWDPIQEGLCDHGPILTLDSNAMPSISLQSTKG